MNLHPNLTLGQIASGMEAAIPYFEKAKFDYTLEGDLTLSQACEGAGLPLEEALLALGKIAAQENREEHWETRPLSELVEHILRYHHAYTRKQIEKINILLRDAAMALGFSNPQLMMLKNLFLEMGGEMRGHMAREEDLLFPYLLQKETAEAGHQAVSNPFTESPFFRQPARILQWEHRMTGEEWNQVRLLTDNYQISGTAGENVRNLYRELEDLERDLHRHVHLENNILFKRAVEKGWVL